ncbi:MAG TPA: hypothetical protein PLD40_06240 [Kiritimatiellia bacterium]|jgi:hypothetical protein|nr:MAG: hypothetical protein BWX54_00561 [Verrucomicrobia bacterium ADurb.Bin018]HOE00027.1 hypothetical protein [Kiritimatiellia bacterium]HOE36327.1 hypothetical protein [Kiritimatiellia bacterium]HOR73913.1 hypothetical protein [Kiritimatiellia bacterium]HOU58335.1 hypothetical protein [Kiritimatiellia bacterium]
MTPDKRFIQLPKSFWALVRLIGQECGYAAGGQITVASKAEVQAALAKLKLDPKSLDTALPDGRPVWKTLVAYFTHRRDTLHGQVEPNLMDSKQAKIEFTKLKRQLKPTCPLPMNKQKGMKKAPAYLTGMVNMLVEANAGEHQCDYDPRALATIATNGLPLRTFARRMDGAFPSVINPIAVWEVKEYYYTTTFGSRVADGVYETLLDGMEIEELLLTEKMNVLHYLIIDAHYTWWDCGKSYLCRIVDMLHMGYVDEVLVGKEVISRIPELVKTWVKKMA